MVINQTASNIIFWKDVFQKNVVLKHFLMILFSELKEIFKSSLHKWVLIRTLYLEEI